MSAGDTIVRDAYLASRDAVLDIAVRDGTITTVGPEIETEVDEASELDAAGNLVFPGFVDAHVHDGGTLGTYTLERFAEHAVQRGYESRITASHAFALADAAVQSLRLDRSYTYSTNPGLARLWDLLTHGGAAVLGIDGYGIEPGTPADFVVTDAPSPQWAILGQADAAYVVRRGAVVAEDGGLVD